MNIPLEPLGYHRAILDYLKKEEAELWDWFATTRETAKAADSTRLELLKSAYRLERDDKAELYELADAAREKLGLDCALTLYKAQHPDGCNVSLSYLPGEAHIVLEGPVQELLDRREMESVLAHELSHFLFFHEWDQEFFIADQLLRAMASDVAAEPAHFESVRLFSLYTEILCDRGGLHVVEDVSPPIATLLKIETGEREVNPEAYLRQAEEILAKDDAGSLGVTHPEAFVRARALEVWSSNRDEADELARTLVEGGARLDRLDLLGRKHVERLTRRVLERVLKPDWIRTDAVLAHARHFFDDFVPSGDDDPADVDDVLAKDLATKDEKLLDYYSYVMLDFIAVERDHDEAPLAAMLQLAEKLGLRSRLRELAAKELKLKKREMDRVFKEADRILSRAQRPDA